MPRNYKAIKISSQGFLTNERDEPIICPIRDSNCNLKCAWFTIDDGVFRCKDTIIGALRKRPLRSFRLYKGPDIYDLDEALKTNELNG